MNKIERVRAAIHFEWVDQIPKGEFHIEDGFAAKLLDIQQHVTMEDRIKACNLCGLDALAFSSAPPQPDHSVWSELKRWREETDFFIFAIIDGPFQGSAKLFASFTDYLLAIAKNDPIIPELVAKSVAENVSLGLNALANGANGIIIADDIAYQGGTFISPAALRNYFFPGVKQQVERFQAEKCPVFFHADGNLLPVLSDLVNLGLDGLHSLDFSSLENIAKAKLMTHKRLCLMGGYDLGWFSGENRQEMALKLLAVAAEGGGYIFGTSAGIIGSDLSVAEVLAVYGSVSSSVKK